MDFEELLHRYRSTSASVTKNVDVGGELNVDRNMDDTMNMGAGGGTDEGFEFPVMKTSADEKKDDEKTVKSKKISATLLAKLLLERQNKNRLEKNSMVVEKPVQPVIVEGKKDLSEEIQKNNRILDSIMKGGSALVDSLQPSHSGSRPSYPKNLFIENEEVEPVSVTNNNVNIVNNENSNNIYQPQPTPVMTIEEMLTNPEYPISLSDSVTVSEIRARVREEENQKYMSRREIEEKVKRCCEISEDIHLAVKNMQEHVYRLDIHFRFLRQIMAIDDSEIEAYIKEISLYPSPSNPEEEEEDNHAEKLSSFQFASTSSSKPELPVSNPEDVEDVDVVEDVEETIPVYEIEDVEEEDVPVDLIDVVENQEDQEDQEENTKENFEDNNDLPTNNNNVSIFAPLRAQVRPNGIFGNSNMKKFQTIY